MLSFHFLCWKPLLSLSKIKLGLNECFSLYRVLPQNFRSLRDLHAFISFDLFISYTGSLSFAHCWDCILGLLLFLQALGNILHAAFNYYCLLTENQFPEFVPVPAAQLFKMNLSCTELTAVFLIWPSTQSPSEWSSNRTGIFAFGWSSIGCWGVISPLEKCFLYSFKDFMI